MSAAAEVEDEAGGRAPRYDTAHDHTPEADRRRPPAGLGPLGRFCPICGSGPGQRCTVNGRSVTSATIVHKARQG